MKRRGFGFVNLVPTGEPSESPPPFLLVYCLVLPNSLSPSDYFSNLNVKLLFLTRFSFPHLSRSLPLPYYSPTEHRLFSLSLSTLFFKRKFAIFLNSSKVGMFSISFCLSIFFIISLLTKHCHRQNKRLPCRATFPQRVPLYTPSPHPSSQPNPHRHLC